MSARSSTADVAQDPGPGIRWCGFAVNRYGSAASLRDTNPCDRGLTRGMPRRGVEVFHHAEHRRLAVQDAIALRAGSDASALRGLVRRSMGAARARSFLFPAVIYDGSRPPGQRAGAGRAGLGGAVQGRGTPDGCVTARRLDPRRG